MGHGAYKIQLSDSILVIHKHSQQKRDNVEFYYWIMYPQTLHPALLPKQIYLLVEFIPNISNIKKKQIE